MSAADTVVIHNPRAGKGRAAGQLRRLRQALGPGTEFVPTRQPGHAEELATQAALAGVATVGAAGGDGTVHEVANGLLRAGRPEVVLAVYPIGSANDYAYSLGLGCDWWLRPDPGVVVRAVDVGLAKAPDGRRRYFVNGFGLGFNGWVTLESRRIQGLRGPALYTLALLQALCRHYKQPMMSLRIDEEGWKCPTLALSLAIGRREGNFLMAPAAEIDDGLFDYLHAGELARWQLPLYLPGMLTGRLPERDPALRRGRCRAVSVESEAPLIAHVDGEFFCLPQDDVRRVEVRLLPGGLRVLGRQKS